MERVNPLSVGQLDELDQTRDPEARPFRLLANGQAVTIETGACYSKGSSTFYHPIYWDQPKKVRTQILAFMRENNPGVKFRITYH